MRIVRIEGHVGCVEGFDAIPMVLNGGSELIKHRSRPHSRTPCAHGAGPSRRDLSLERAGDARLLGRGDRVVCGNGPSNTTGTPACARGAIGIESRDSRIGDTESIERFDLAVHGTDSNQPAHASTDVVLRLSSPIHGSRAGPDPGLPTNTPTWIDRSSTDF